LITRNYDLCYRYNHRQESPINHPLLRFLFVHPISPSPLEFWVILRFEQDIHLIRLPILALSIVVPYPLPHEYRSILNLLSTSIYSRFSDLIDDRGQQNLNRKVTIVPHDTLGRKCVLMATTAQNWMVQIPAGIVSTQFRSTSSCWPCTGKRSWFARRYRGPSHQRRQWLRWRTANRCPRLYPRRHLRWTPLQTTKIHSRLLVRSVSDYISCSGGCAGCKASKVVYAMERDSIFRPHVLENILMTHLLEIQLNCRGRARASYLVTVGILVDGEVCASGAAMPTSASNVGHAAEHDRRQRVELPKFDVVLKTVRTGKGGEQWRRGTY